MTRTEKRGIPYVHGQSKDGQEIFDYMVKVTREAGFDTEFAWDGDEVVIR